MILFWFFVHVFLGVFINKKGDPLQPITYAIPHPKNQFDQIIIPNHRTPSPKHCTPSQFPLLGSFLNKIKKEQIYWVDTGL